MVGSDEFQIAGDYTLAGGHGNTVSYQHDFDAGETDRPSHLPAEVEIVPGVHTEISAHILTEEDLVDPDVAAATGDLTIGLLEFLIRLLIELGLDALEVGQGLEPPRDTVAGPARIVRPELS